MRLSSLIFPAKPSDTNSPRATMKAMFTKATPRVSPRSRGLTPSAGSVRPYRRRAKPATGQSSSVPRNAASAIPATTKLNGRVSTNPMRSSSWPPRNAIRVTSPEESATNPMR